MLAEYIWLDVDQNTRSKSRVLLPNAANDTISLPIPSELPIWNFDGSSTGQAPGNDSEVTLHPVAVYPDPFRRLPHILVLCECRAHGAVIASNTRAAALEIMNKAELDKPWFGIEQEYTLFGDRHTPPRLAQGRIPCPSGSVQLQCR